MKEEKINKIIDELERFQDDLSPYSKEWSDYWEAIAYLKLALTRVNSPKKLKVEII